MRTVASLALAVSLLVIGCGPSFVQPPPLIPREILVGNPERASPQVSPDGKIISYLAPGKNNVLQIWLRTLGEQDDRQLTDQKTRSIENYTWSYDNEHLIFAQDSDGDENWHLHVVSIQSDNNKPLEYVVTYGDEGHRFTRPETRYHFYAKAEEFLAKHLGGVSNPLENSQVTAVLCNDRSLFPLSPLISICGYRGDTEYRLSPTSFIDFRVI